jgi:hypothetical protein
VDHSLRSLLTDPPLDAVTLPLADALEVNKICVDSLERNAIDATVIEPDIDLLVC